MERRTHDGANTETETVIPYGTNDLTHSEMQEVLSELCLRLRISAVRTNATKHGYVEMQVRDDPPPPPAPVPPSADLAATQQEIARLRAALAEIYPPIRSEYFDKNEQQRQHAYVSGYEAALADVREALK